MNARLQEDQARAAVAVGADLDRDDRVMQFVLALTVHLLAGVVAILALFLTPFIGVLFVDPGQLMPLNVVDVVVEGVSGSLLIGFYYSAFALLWGVYCAWSVVPLGIWSLRSPRSSFVGLLIALASSAVVLAWTAVLVSGDSTGWSFAGLMGEGGSDSRTGFLFQDLALHPTFFTGWYLMPLVCWLWVPLRFMRAWWRLPLFAAVGSVIGYVLSLGAEFDALGFGWVVVVSHAGYVIGLVWCRLHHRRSPDFGHPSSGGRPPQVPGGESVASKRGGRVEARAEVQG